jgi:hypothetical protein
MNKRELYALQMAQRITRMLLEGASHVKTVLPLAQLEVEGHWEEDQLVTIIKGLERGK